MILLLLLSSAAFVLAGPSEHEKGKAIQVPWAEDTDAACAFEHAEDQWFHDYPQEDDHDQDITQHELYGSYK